MFGPSIEPKAIANRLNREAAPFDWNAALRAELDRAVIEGNGRWSRALIGRRVDPPGHVPCLPGPSRSAG